MENRKWGVRIMEAKKYRRIFTIVVDSCGIGGAKDAERFGDAGTDTLGHIAETVGNSEYAETWNCQFKRAEEYRTGGKTNGIFYKTF